MTDGNGNTTQYAYDARKRLVTTTYPDTTTVTNSYDGPGNLSSVLDQNKNIVQYKYDAANQLTSVIQTASPSSANTNLYAYDPLGNLAALTDENLHTTQNLFDLYGEPVQKTLPDQTLFEARTYDAAGNLQTLTHFNGVTTTYTYDALNRLTSRVTPGKPAVSFAYTATGKRATMSDGSGTTTYAYDAMDRLATKATPEGTLNYGYDAASNVASIVSNDANGVSVSYVYDQLNRLSTVTDNRLQGSQTTTYTYDPASNLGTVTYPNGVESAMTYDALNRISGLTTQSTGYLYQRGPTGSLTGATELNGRTLTWNYDGTYRLTNETIASDPSNNNGSSSYTLDPVGNRLAESTTLPGLTSGSFGYNADDEVSNETYDANGNTLSTGGKSFTYDAENDLTSMNGGAVTIVYDGDGNRVAKTVNGVTTKYLVDDLNPTGYPQVVEELVGGVVTRQYTYGQQRISENQIVNNTWTPNFYGYDGGGNVRQLTDVLGAVTDTYEYDAFGVGVSTSGHTPNEMLYRGEQYDSDLSLYYFRARYYNPATGRFMSMDPEEGIATEPSTLHKYDYAGEDPVNRIDPAGRASAAAGRSTSEYGNLIINVSLSAPVINGVGATATAIVCAYIWEGTKTQAEVDAALSHGHVEWVPPCFWVAVAGQLPTDPPLPVIPPIALPGTPAGPGRCPDDEDKHHLLPQQFRDWFEEPPRNLDIDDPEFLRCVPRNCHTGSEGLHGNQNGTGTNWNAEWLAFKNANPGASAQEVLEFLEDLMDLFSTIDCESSD